MCTWPFFVLKYGSWVFSTKKGPLQEGERGEALGASSQFQYRRRATSLSPQTAQKKCACGAKSCSLRSRRKLRFRQRRSRCYLLGPWARGGRVPGCGRGGPFGPVRRLLAPRPAPFRLVWPGGRMRAACVGCRQPLKLEILSHNLHVHPRQPLEGKQRRIMVRSTPSGSQRKYNDRLSVPKRKVLAAREGELFPVTCSHVIRYPAWHCLAALRTPSIRDVHSFRIPLQVRRPSVGAKKALADR
jgi:hypothetical protein